jgi:hypothetical protein
MYGYPHSALFRLGLPVRTRNPSGLPSAYHPQTKGPPGRSEQTARIPSEVRCMEFQDLPWMDVTPAIPAVANVSRTRLQPRSSRSAVEAAPASQKTWRESHIMKTQRAVDCADGVAWLYSKAGNEGSTRLGCCCNRALLRGPNHPRSLAGRGQGRSRVQTWRHHN